MTTTEIKTIRLEADEGKILTDGQTYGSVIFLGANRNIEEFYEISKEEYEEMIKEECDEFIEEEYEEILEEEVENNEDLY